MRQKKCPRCQEVYPSKAAFMRHWNAKCCAVPKDHIACSVCSPILGKLAKVASDFMEDEIERTPEDVASFSRDMLRIRLVREEFGA